MHNPPLQYLDARHPAAPMTSTAHVREPGQVFGWTEWALLATAAIIWGASFLFIEIALESTRPGLIALVRLALGAATLSVFPAARTKVPRHLWGGITGLALFWMAIPFSLLPVAQQHVSSSVAGMLNGSTPIHVAAIAALLAGRAPARIQAFGLALGLIGVALISSSSSDSGEANAWGIGLTLVVAFSYAIGITIAAPLQRQVGSLPILLRGLTLATLLALPAGLASAADSTITQSAALALLALGIGGSGIAYVALTTLVGRAGASRGSIAVYFVPIVALFLGAIVRDDQVTTAAVIGIAAVILGAVCTSRAVPARSP